MTFKDEYDPERALWVCGRRSFMFLFGATALGTALGVRTGGAGWQDFGAGVPVNLHGMVEVFPVGRPGAQVGFGTSFRIAREEVAHHGLTRVIARPTWHLSDDGQILWRELPAPPEERRLHRVVGDPAGEGALVVTRPVGKGALIDLESGAQLTTGHASKTFEETFDDLVRMER